MGLLLQFLFQLCSIWKNSFTTNKSNLPAITMSDHCWRCIIVELLLVAVWLENIMYFFIITFELLAIPVLIHNAYNKDKNKMSALVDRASIGFTNTTTTTIPTQTIIRTYTTGFDETDNNTKDTKYRNINVKPRYIMNDRFHREDERLRTYDNWPADSPMNKFKLAQTGMFYTGEYDKVKCYFCEVEIGRWEPDDHPVSEHLRWSPNCPLLRRRTTNNVPINVEALERILPPVSYDVCGYMDSIAPPPAVEIRPNVSSEGTIPSANLSAAIAGNTAPSTYYHEYPEYAVEAARIRSFAEWPRHMKQKPEQLAEAGFFYTGVGDRVKCFSCGGGLKDWDDEDEPWEQHALWLSKCRFLNLIKGKTFIDATVAKYKNVEDTTATAAPSSEAVATETALVSAAEIEAPSNSLRTLMPCATTLACKAAMTTTTKVEDIISDKTEKKFIPEEKLCKICYADEYNTAFLPCGHVVACAKCASSVTKCPLCRKPFTDVMRVYFS